MYNYNNFKTTKMFKVSLTMTAINKISVVNIKNSKYTVY